ncbi:MAG: carbon-nitrogen hydrolase family protein, partial [Candidatus Omnitrophica bacterium]|nr:carbon-nitrogen hydrolase family protein [Candidatus Omnitrophota bacterium]
SAGLGAAALAKTSDASEQSGRKPNRHEVWIASITLERLDARSGEEKVDKVIGRMEETLHCRPDVICIPETFPYHGVSNKPPLEQIAKDGLGWIAGRFGEFARNNQCYIICPTHTYVDGVIYNSAIIIDRRGEVAGLYHKIHPTVDEIEGGAMPGPVQPPVFQTDFGVIGVQICFDVNWPEGWRALRKAGAEVIFWPSAFPGGRMLNGMAWMNKTYVVTSTWDDPSRIIDIQGDEIASTGRYQHWICAPVNLEKAFVHIWPYMKNIEDLQAKYGRKIRIQKLHVEGWAVIESVSPDLTIQKALAEFDIPLHEEHIQKAHALQEKMRPS